MKAEGTKDVVDLIWLIPLLPGIGAAINGLVGIRAFSKNVAALVACSTMGLAMLLSAWAFWDLLALAPEARDHVVTIATWIPRIPLETANGIGGFEVPWAFRLDPSVRDDDSGRYGHRIPDPCVCDCVHAR